MVFLQAFLDELDRSDIVRRFAASADLSGDGEERIKAHVCQLIQGSRHFTLKTVTPSQWAVVRRICEDISTSAPGELYAAAVGVALANATELWYENDYEQSVAVATHVIVHIDAEAGEAYRIRAFGHFSSGRFSESKADLERALQCSARPDGVKDLLDAATRLSAGVKLSEADFARLLKVGLVGVSSLDGDFHNASEAELAARLGLLQMLDGLLGASNPDGMILEYVKASIIRDAIGDNRNASAFARTFRMSRSESAEKLLATGDAEATLRRLVKKALLEPAVRAAVEADQTAPWVF